MTHTMFLRTLLLLFVSSGVSAQVMTFPTAPGNSMGTATSMNLVQSTVMDHNLWMINSEMRSPLESRNGSVSKLDLKAPAKARREYEKGYQLLMKKDLPAAVAHLTAAVSIYPSFVSAYNALGAAHLALGNSDEAREKFVQAVALDDHLPTSYFNLGCAELALKRYPAAQDSIQK